MRGRADCPIDRDGGRGAEPYAAARWYGEPPEETLRDFLHRARLLRLDALTSPRSSELLTTRLWRRYGMQALGLLEDIRAEPGMAEVLIEGAEYLRCEIAQAARHEMIGNRPATGVVTA